MNKKRIGANTLKRPKKLRTTLIIINDPSIVYPKYSHFHVIIPPVSNLAILYTLVALCVRGRKLNIEFSALLYNIHVHTDPIDLLIPAKHFGSHHKTPYSAKMENYRTVLHAL